jgi:SnoaL-like domain
MTIQLPATDTAYIRSINDGDAAAFITLFGDGAVVNDVGREFRGLAAIKEWSDREIFAPQVTLEVIDVVEHDGETVVATKVDGNFDRNGLPDPVIINHHITVQGGKIVGLTCRLAGEKSKT